LIWMKFLFLLIKWEFQVETIWRKQPKEKNNMKTIYSITIFSVCYLPVVRTDVAKVLCRKHGK
jgi:hypothetical protein